MKNRLSNYNDAIKKVGKVFKETVEWSADATEKEQLELFDRFLAQMAILTNVHEELEKEFLDDPVAVEKIIIYWLNRLVTLDRSFHKVWNTSNSIKNFWTIGLVIRILIYHLSNYVNGYKVEFELTDQEKEIGVSALTIKTKSSMPVYYRYQLLKSFDLENKVKLFSAGDRNKVISSLINCDEKTARDLYAEKYKKGINTDDELELKRLVALFN